MERIVFTAKHEELLLQIPLFKDLSPKVQHSLLERLDCAVYNIKKNDIIARQDSPCRELMVLLEGKLKVDIIDALCNEVLIEHIIAPRAFATPHLFKADTTLPATFKATEDGVLLKATKDSVFKLISEFPDLLKSFCVLLETVISALFCVCGYCRIKIYAVVLLLIFSNKNWSIIILSILIIIRLNWRIIYVLPALP